MRFKLVDHGYPFKKIMQGKRWVGRVAKCEDGRYIAVIGKHITKYGNTEVGAFEKAAAEALGYESPEALRMHNAAVRADNRQRSARGRQIAHDFLRAKTFEERFDILDRAFGFKK